jgi:DNA polymerase-3 subunit epsilon
MSRSLMNYAAALRGKYRRYEESKRPSGDAHPSRGAEKLPLEEIPFVVLDTELTGLKARKDSIVSIGAVKMRGTTILLGETFYRVARPRTALTATSVIVHEITPTETSEAPGIDTLLPEFLEFCGEAVIVGHVVSIDIQFLNREMKELYAKALQNPSVDTCRLHRWIREKEENCDAFHGGISECVDLFSLATQYGIPVQQAHHALGDAYITAQLFQRLLKELPGWGITTVDGLLRIGKS